MSEENRIQVLARQMLAERRQKRMEQASENKLQKPPEPIEDTPAPQHNAPQTDEEELELFRSILAARTAVPKRKHPQYDSLRRWLAIGKHVYLVGPAGSGKTTAAKQIAEELNIPFAAPSIGRETTKSEIFGFIHAHGLTVRTMFRECWENGGLILLDEFDYSSAAVGTSLNTATSQPFAGFPDATIAQHPNFRLVATANTYGTGATQQYIGSNPLNPATLDRFVFLEWNYDETLERAISLNLDWCIHVQKTRAAIQQEKINFVVSPRATINGADGLAAGFTLAEVEASVLFKGLDPLLIEKVRARIATGQL